MNDAQAQKNLALATVFISAATLWGAETMAASVCYKVTSGGNSNGNIYRLDIQRHSLLTSYAESGRHIQTAYSVHGKVVPFANAMGTVTGTVVVARGEGVRLGIHRNSVSLGGVYAVLFAVRAVTAVPDTTRTVMMLAGATALGWAVVAALRRTGEWPGVRRALAVAVALGWVVTGIRVVLL